MNKIISLNRNEQFLQVYKKGKRTYHKNFTLHFLPNQLNTNRLGIKAGKKQRALMAAEAAAAETEPAQ